MASRRTVLKNAVGGGAAMAASSFSAASYARIIGSNDRLNLAIMGVRSRGKLLAQSFHRIDQNISRLVDVDRRVLAKIGSELANFGVKGAQPEIDVRRTLESKDIDALVVATPDHWHAPAAMMAMDAGKHVYLEKPSNHNPQEGEWLVAAQARTGKIVQMGNQQRSSPQTIALMRAVRDGELGDLYHAETWYANARGSIGNGQQVAPPDELDWDLWQGPAPRRAYQDNVVPYNWHWFWHWGTGETCNNAAHELDVARWALDVQNPREVSAQGSRRFFKDDDWEMYDTLEARFEYSHGRTITWEGHSCNRVKQYGRGRGTCLYGTKGWAIVDREGFEIYDRNGKLVREAKRATSSTNTADLVGGGRLTDLHVQNFVDSVRGTATQQHSPIDEGVTSTLMCHLANIAYRTGETLRTDSGTGRIENDCAQPYWGREYEPGWQPRV